MDHRKEIETLIETKKFDDVYKTIECLAVTTNQAEKRMLIRYWDEAHIQEELLKNSKKKATPVFRCRIREKHPPPVSICPSGRRKNVLSPNAKKCLVLWLASHSKYPYPSNEEKTDLAKRTNLSVDQVGNWFANARRRKRSVKRKGQFRSTLASSQQINSPVIASPVINSPGGIKSPVIYPPVTTANLFVNTNILPIPRQSYSSVNGINECARIEKLQSGILHENQSEKLNAVVVELPVATLGHHGNQSSLASSMVDGVKGRAICADAPGIQSGISSATTGQQVWVFSPLNADDVDNGFIVLDALYGCVTDASASMLHGNIQVRCHDSETGCPSRSSGCFNEFPSQQHTGGALHGQCLSSEVEMVSQDKALLTTDDDQCPVNGLECSYLVPESLDSTNGYCNETSSSLWSTDAADEAMTDTEAANILLSLSQ